MPILTNSFNKNSGDIMGNYIVGQNNKIYKRALEREINVWRNAA
jgi:hypothetical protein